ncbi:MAG: hypothetical protein IJ272_05980 [Clostridia bacterium]|nr:hypothetical protein [Clostridia bacterium]
MNKVNEIVFCKEDFNNNIEEMFNTIGKQLQILTQCGNICTFYADEVNMGIYVIQYEHDDRHPRDDFSYFGVVNPYWLTPEEVDEVENYRNSKETEVENDNKSVE